MVLEKPFHHSLVSVVQDPPKLDKGGGSIEDLHLSFMFCLGIILEKVWRFGVNPYVDWGRNHPLEEIRELHHVLVFSFVCLLIFHSCYNSHGHCIV